MLRKYYLINQTNTDVRVWCYNITYYMFGVSAHPLALLACNRYVICIFVYVRYPDT